MTTMHQDHASVNPAPAELWPAWTDESAWTTGPDVEDAQWAAQTFGADFDSDDDEGPIDEDRALESAAMDAIERSLIAPDLADALSRGSLVGLADAILHSGSDVNTCLCESCVWTRTARYA